jgi:hypothetical protein
LIGFDEVISKLRWYNEQAERINPVGLLKQKVSDNTELCIASPNIQSRFWGTIINDRYSNDCIQSAQMHYKSSALYCQDISLTYFTTSHLSLITWGSDSY